MAQYRAPVEDMQFVLFDVFKAQQHWHSLDSALDQDTANAMLVEAGKVAEQQLAPVNRSGDEQGVALAEGEVTTPNGFKQAYNVFAENGLCALTGNPSYGGLGMPKSLGLLVDEMNYAANSSFALYPALSAGACMTIDAHGSEQLKQRFLPPMYSGQWGGTMCLTEPHSGSDLGLMRTKAEPREDGTYSISGTKIFITGGDHDLTENIIHLVLARLPDAPAGSKGISLFLVPKIWVGDEGELKERNPVTCGAVEHKMGIKASATCVMNFDGARGFLIGEPNRGLQCMFTMMNAERLSIGMQGVGCADASYQNAVEYARERLQGRAKGSKQVADPIIKHGDVRRMLMTMKSTTEAGRALAVYLGQQLDFSNHGATPEERATADTRVALLTPVAKAMFTDLGLESTVLGQQVFGGHGYIREWGQEQLVRDVRIAQIYEGTNGIQAMDLLHRKVFVNNGEWLESFVTEIKQSCQGLENDQLAGYGQALTARCDQLMAVTSLLLQRGEHNTDELGVAACEFLHCVGYVTYGYMWLRMMEAAQSKVDSSASMAAKMKTGAFFFSRILPRMDSLIAVIESGSDHAFGLSEDDF